MDLYKHNQGTFLSPPTYCKFSEKMIHRRPREDTSRIFGKVSLSRAYMRVRALCAHACTHVREIQKLPLDLFATGGLHGAHQR